MALSSKAAVVGLFASLVARAAAAFESCQEAYNAVEGSELEPGVCENVSYCDTDTECFSALKAVSNLCTTEADDYTGMLYKEMGRVTLDGCECIDILATLESACSGGPGSDTLCTDCIGGLATMRDHKACAEVPRIMLESGAMKNETFNDWASDLLQQMNGFCNLSPCMLTFMGAGAVCEEANQDPCACDAAFKTLNKTCTRDDTFVDEYGQKVPILDLAGEMQPWVSVWCNMQNGDVEDFGCLENLVMAGMVCEEGVEGFDVCTCAKVFENMARTCTDEETYDEEGEGTKRVMELVNNTLPYVRMACHMEGGGEHGGGNLTYGCLETLMWAGPVCEDGMDQDICVCSTLFGYMKDVCTEEDTYAEDGTMKKVLDLVRLVGPSMREACAMEGGSCVAIEPRLAKKFDVRHCK